MRGALATLILLAAPLAHAQPQRAFAPPAEPPAPPPLGWAGELVGPRSRAALEGAEAPTRAAAAARLGRWGDARRSVTALLERLEREEDARVRAAIFEALARRGDVGVVPAIAQNLTEWERADRAAALRAIGVLGGERAIRVLVDWLAASDVGEEAMNGLVRVGAPSVPHLIGALEVPIASVRAAIALGRIGDARATYPLVSRLRGAHGAARIAMIRSLGAIADERATPALVRALEDSDPATVAAALGALARVAGPEHAAPVARLAERGTSEQRAAALGALVVMDPVAAAPRLEAAIVDPASSALLRAAAIEALLAHPSPPLQGALLALMASPADRMAAAEALSRVEGDASARALLDAARADADRALDPALARAVRRHEGALDGDLLASARLHLRGDDSARGLVLSALARDEASRSEIALRLGHADPLERAFAASAAQLLGDRFGSDRATLGSRLAEETDPRAFRALALAVLAAGVPVDPADVDSRFWDPSTAPEALWVAAANLDRARPRARDRARRAMRRALRSAQPRVRAGGAIALAIVGDRAAWRALVAALEDEHDAVRLAVARALEVLSVPEASTPIAAVARIEREERVRRALSAASSSPGRRSPPPFRVGDSVLHVRISTAEGLPRGPELAVDVLLPDGRWLSTLALGTGEVFVPDLPEGEAEVEVRVDP